MKNLVFLFAILTITTASYAQESAQILNQKTNEPIPYVNIQVLRKRQGYTSNLDGQFKINAQEGDSLVFSAIGYKNKTLITGAITNKVFLEPTSYNIPEITIRNEKERTITIGWVRKQIFSWHYGNSNGSQMIARFFPYDSAYRNTNFLKYIAFLTESEVEQATFNVRLCIPDSSGKPGTPIFNQNLFTIAEQGYNKTIIQLTKHAIQFPKEGLFVIIEWLDIAENKREYSIEDLRTGKEIKMISIEPSFAAESHEKNEKGWTNWGGWKQSSNIFEKPIQMKIVLRN